MPSAVVTGGELPRPYSRARVGSLQATVPLIDIRVTNMGEFTDGGYFVEFVLERPVSEVWQALQQGNDKQPVWFTAWPCMPTFDTTGK